MVRSKKHFAEFEPHSRFKHLVFEQYFEMWGRKLLLGRAAELVCYVDACAGRGADEAGNQGSPVIAADAAADAVEQLSAMPQMRDRSVRLPVVAIEKDAGHYEALLANLAPFGSDVAALPGTLRDHIDAIDTQFGNPPTLYFIDPFGLEPLQADVVRRALAGPKNEVLLLFADGAALRHFGAAMTTETRAMQELQRARDTPTLFAEEDERRLAELGPRADQSRKALEITAEQAERIMNAAYGGTQWGEAISPAVPQAQRRGKFLDLYLDLLRSFGAAYVLPFPVLNERGAHVYSLVHASKSAAGYRTMKEAVTYALKHGPLPGPVVDEMKARMGADLADVVRRLRASLAGQSVRWTDDEGGFRALGLYSRLLNETRVYPFQRDALKQQLRPFKRLANGREYYAFPQAVTLPAQDTR